MMSSLARVFQNQAFRISLAALGLSFVTIQLIRFDFSILGQKRGWIAPVLGATALASLASLGAAGTWSLLVGGDLRRTSAAYLAALPAKYLPGGLGLPVAQVSHGVAEGIGASRSILAIGVQVVVSVASAGLVGLVMWPSSGLAFWVFALQVMLIASFWPARRLVVWAANRWSRDGAEPVPSRRIAGGFAVTFFSIAGMAAGFALIGTLLHPDLGFGFYASAFSLAWAVGLLAIPVPGGIGVREGVLVLLAPSGAGAAMVTASVVFRIVSIGGELAAWVSSLAFSTRRTRRDRALAFRDKS